MPSVLIEMRRPYMREEEIALMGPVKGGDFNLPIHDQPNFLSFTASSLSNSPQSACAH